MKITAATPQKPETGSNLVRISLLIGRIIRITRFNAVQPQHLQPTAKTFQFGSSHAVHHQGVCPDSNAARGLDGGNGRGSRGNLSGHIRGFSPCQVAVKGMLDRFAAPAVDQRLSKMRPALNFTALAGRHILMINPAAEGLQPMQDLPIPFLPETDRFRKKGSQRQALMINEKPDDVYVMAIQMTGQFNTWHREYRPASTGLKKFRNSVQSVMISESQGVQGCGFRHLYKFTRNKSTVGFAAVAVKVNHGLWGLWDNDLILSRRGSILMG